MGRSIPSFRMLIDIERLEWKVFKERLSNKHDKESFNYLFAIPKLYCHSFSNVSKPMVMEPILLSVLFHSFKEIDKIVNKSIISVDRSNISIDHRKFFDIEHLGSKLKSNAKPSQSGFSTKTNDEGWYNDYNYTRILEDWKEFSDCLSIEESVFIDKLTNCYNSYHRSINSCGDNGNNNNNNNNNNSKYNKDKKSKSCLNRINPLFMALFLYQQKQLNLIKSNQRLLDSYH